MKSALFIASMLMIASCAAQKIPEEKEKELAQVWANHAKSMAWVGKPIDDIIKIQGKPDAITKENIAYALDCSDVKYLSPHMTAEAISKLSNPEDYECKKIKKSGSVYHYSKPRIQQTSARMSCDIEIEVLDGKTKGSKIECFDNVCKKNFPQFYQWMQGDVSPTCILPK